MFGRLLYSDLSVPEGYCARHVWNDVLYLPGRIGSTCLVGVIVARVPLE